MVYSSTSLLWSFLRKHVGSRRGGPWPSQWLFYPMSWAALGTWGLLSKSLLKEWCADLFFFNVRLLFNNKIKRFILVPELGRGLDILCRQPEIHVFNQDNCTWTHSHLLMQSFLLKLSSWATLSKTRQNSVQDEPLTGLEGLLILLPRMFSDQPSSALSLLPSFSFG